MDTVQFMNVAKDDALAYPEVRQRTYPKVVNEHMSTITDFIRTCELGPRIPLINVSMAC